jgi:hypothetical protein
MKLSVEKINQPTSKVSFNCGVRSIQRLVGEAYEATLYKQAVAYNILLDGVVVGQYMLTIAAVDVCDYTWTYGRYKFPVVKIEYLAVEENKQGIGIGTAILARIAAEAKYYSQIYPFRFLYFDSVQDRVEWYKERGFSNFPGKSYDEYTVPMCMDFIDQAAVDQFCENEI